jgi:nitrite reductase/ring-hydroxylating ferredoxin subunit
MKWVVTILLQYEWRTRTAESGTERKTMETNTHLADVVDSPVQSEVLKDNQFRVEAVPGSALLVGEVAVFNVAGSFCATQAKCTHWGGPLNVGGLEGSTVTCPWHGTQYNVCTGAVLLGPATEPVRTYRVIVEGAIGTSQKKADGDET